MTTRICWNCRWFEADDTQGTYSGKCRRHAPRGFDSNSYVGDVTRNSHRVQMGRVNNGIMTSAASPINTYITQGVNVLPTANGSGFAGDGCFPFTIGPGHKLTKIHVETLLMNTGAATVGTNPVFKMGIYTVDESTDTLVNTLEIPVPAADVGIAGNTTNNMFSVDYTLATPWPESELGVGLWAMKFILESGDENIIGEIDNTIVSGELDFYGPSPTDERLFPWIIEGNTFWCGEFQKQTGTIPVLV